MTRILILAILLLTSCTIAGPSTEDGKDECGYSWTYIGGAVPEDRWEVFEVADVFLKCLFLTHAEACSQRYIAADGELSGRVWLPRDYGTGYCKSKEYYLRHEGLHLKGWVHPDWTRAN